MVGEAVVSVSLVLIAMFLVFFVFKNEIVFVQGMPDNLLYMSIIGVLIYIGGIAATKSQEGKYNPIHFVPEYMLRLAEAPIFTTVTYALILQQNNALNQPGTLLTIALFIGMFTRNFEEFFKLIGKSVLGAFESGVEKLG